MTAPKEKGSVSIYVYVPENTENFKEDVTLRDRKIPPSSMSLPMMER